MYIYNFAIMLKIMNINKSIKMYQIRVHCHYIILTYVLVLI